MFDLVFFTKSALTDGAGWKSSSGVILGVRDERDDMVDTTFFFLCLGHGRDLFYCYPFSHIWAEHARETQDGENSVCWLVQCNCDMLGDFVSCSCYLLSLDLLSAVFVVTTTKSDHLLLHFFAICLSVAADLDR